MSLLDANGRPTAPQIDSQKLLNILQALQNQIENNGAGITHLSLMLEFILNALLEAKDAEGNQLFSLDLSTFPEFAQQRIKEIQEAARPPVKLEE